MRRGMAAVVVAMGLLFALLTGCVPDDMPAYTPDGKQVVLVADEAGGKGKALWICDMEKRTTEAHRMPDGWEVEGARWLGDKLWVHCQRDEGVLKDKETGKEVMDKETGQPARDIQEMWAQYDVTTGRFAAGVMQIPAAMVAPFVAGYGGKRALFVCTYPRPENSRVREEKEPAWGKKRFRVYTLPELKAKTRAIDSDDIMGAGMNWSIRCVMREIRGGWIWHLVRVKVFDEKGRKACTIGARAIVGEDYPGASAPLYARVSTDQSVIALAFSGGRSSERFLPRYRFEVFEVKTGKRLWGSGSDSLFGTPWVSREAVWTLEHMERKGKAGQKDPLAKFWGPNRNTPADGFVLVRHRAPGKADENAPRDEILEYKVGKGNTISSYAPDAKGKRFLVAVDGKRPRLLVVPMRESVKAEDIVQLDLVEQGGEGGGE